MSGLRPKCDGIVPFGYQIHPVADSKFPPAVPPAEYNASLLKAPPYIRNKHTPLPIPGKPAPIKNGEDIFGRNATNLFPDPLPPSAYNATLLKTNYKGKTPVPIPWTREQAQAEIAQESAGGIIEPRKSLLDIAKTFAETSVDPAEKFWWATHANSLIQLEAIEIQRGLSEAESKEKEDIIAAISERAKDTRHLAIRAQYVAPAAFPTANDIGQAVANALGGPGPRGGPPGGPQGGPQGGPPPPPGPGVQLGAPAPQPGAPAPQQAVPAGLGGPQAVFQQGLQQAAAAQVTIKANQRLDSLGKDRNIAANVEIDTKEDNNILLGLLKQKYGKRKPDPDDVKKWGDALRVFSPQLKDYVTTPNQNDFPKYVLDAIRNRLNESAILVRYLTDIRDVQGNALVQAIDLMLTPPVRPTSGLVLGMKEFAEASAQSKFVTFPNFVPVIL